MKKYAIICFFIIVVFLGNALQKKSVGDSTGDSQNTYVFCEIIQKIPVAYLSGNSFPGFGHFLSADLQFPLFHAQNRIFTNSFHITAENNSTPIFIANGAGLQISPLAFFSVQTGFTNFFVHNGAQLARDMITGNSATTSFSWMWVNRLSFGVTLRFGTEPWLRWCKLVFVNNFNANYSFVSGEPIGDFLGTEELVQNLFAPGWKFNNQTRILWNEALFAPFNECTVNYCFGNSDDPLTLLAGGGAVWKIPPAQFTLIASASVYCISQEHQKEVRITLAGVKRYSIDIFGEKGELHGNGAD